MEWVLQSPQIHNTFSNLGYAHADGYHIGENCIAALEAILFNVMTEDKYLRNYRRNISFGQNIKKDLIPLLINSKEDKCLEILIQIFVNLTTPIECLFNVEDISKSDFGRHTVFEINNLLITTKTALTDQRATKAIVDFLKKNSECETKTDTSLQRSLNIGNTLLFLRNILHIPEDPVTNHNPNFNGPTHTVQNKILWNLFSHSLDKVLIKLMTIPESGNWGVTMVQLIALLYKDQHVTTLHKLLNVWLETSLSESSEDNESNTSPPNRGSNDSSPMLTSDPTSDSSDTGVSGKNNDQSDTANNTWDKERNNSQENNNQSTTTTTAATSPSDTIVANHSNDNESKENVDISNQSSLSENIVTDTTSQCHSTNNEKKSLATENSDCGYGTQIENQESISTSSNDDELPSKKPVHQKPLNAKQRQNNKPRSTTTTPQEKKRRKIVKRGKSNIINVQGLSHSTPTDDDVANVLKEFTVDFLFKGFDSLVKTLHNQILYNKHLQIDTSHFFWLITYFLKFATQIELDLENVYTVLSYDIISYITAEGVNICEQFELAIKFDGNEMKPCIRRLHLVVTAIREFVQAIEVYRKSTQTSDEDQKMLKELQMKICETEELRSLMVLLLRHYNPNYHSKQYLQDLIVTNHFLLIFLDGLMKLPEYQGTSTMVDHVRQFATNDVMYQYGLLLEDYEENGEFVNDCVFTVMHHVGGDLDSLICLFQPSIIKTFIAIWKSEFDICDDWSDLVEYVINTFVKKPHALYSRGNFRLETENFEDENEVEAATGADNKKFAKNNPKDRYAWASNNSYDHVVGDRPTHLPAVTIKKYNKWTDDELSSLSWKYLQCNTMPDMIGGILNAYKEDGITKTRESVARQLLQQCLISNEEFNTFMIADEENAAKTNKAANKQSNKESNKKPNKEPTKELDKEPNKKGNKESHKNTRDNKIRKLCDQIAQDNKFKYLQWVQNVLLEICNVKIYMNKKTAAVDKTDIANPEELTGETSAGKKRRIDLPVLSPVSYHCLLFKQSVPLVPWNCEQAGMCKDLKFLRLLHKLGFHMPVDTGKLFIRIPKFWTPDILYEVAAKISAIDPSNLKFSLSDISTSSLQSTGQHLRDTVYAYLPTDFHINESPENFYQVHKQSHLATVVNFTPTPGSSFCPNNDVMNKSNWLHLVQKSHEYKLGLHFRGSNACDDDGDVEMVTTTEVVISNDLATTAMCSTDLAHSILSVPTIMSIKQETASFSPHILDSECNNSICETASVASDLTRMYVSDEDDKLDEMHVDPLVSPLEEPLHPSIINIFPREQFSPTFLTPGRPLSDF